MKHQTPTTGKFLKFVRRLRAVISSEFVSLETIAVGLLERLWHVTITSAPLGDIGRLENDEIAELVGWRGDADLLIQILVETGWLDHSEEHRLVVHDWHEHAPNHVKNSAKRWHKRLISEERQNPPKEPPKENEADTPKERPKETPRAGAVTQPNLTKPNHHPLTPSCPGVGEKSWQVVAVEVSNLGVGDLACVKAATNAGLSVGEIQAIVDHFREHSAENGWRPEALHNRLTNAVPGVPASRSWPPPEKSAAESQERQRRQQADLERQRQRESDRARQKSAESDREARWGARLDGLQQADLEALASSLSPFMLREVRRRDGPKGLSSSVRKNLLVALEKCGGNIPKSHEVQPQAG